jgi:uncharacterized protein (TIGR02246 family)
MPNPIETLFAWWNDAMADPAQLTADNFARYYTPEGRLIVNGLLRAIGPEALAGHYRAVAQRCDKVAMQLPVETAFATSDYAFVHCRTHVIAHGAEAAEEAMAYAAVENDGRIALLRVVSLSV